MPLPKPKLLAGWRRAKLIALINELYLSFAVVAPVGLWSTRLRCPQIHRLDLFVTRWPSTCDAQRDQNSEPKLRPPAVSKSLTRSRRDRPPGLPRRRPTTARGYENLRYKVRIKGNGTKEQFAEIHEAVMATSPNFYNLSRPVALKPTLVVE